MINVLRIWNVESKDGCIYSRRCSRYRRYYVVSESVMWQDAQSPLSPHIELFKHAFTRLQAELFCGIVAEIFRFMAVPGTTAPLLILGVDTEANIQGHK